MSQKIALFGQAQFGCDVLVRLIEAGHTVAAVYAPPEGRRADPLAEEAERRGLPLIRHPRFRRKGAAIPELVDEYRVLGATLNVLAFVTVILPPEIIDGPEEGSICFHPSLLPRFRGGNALAWQIIHGEKESGVTIFQCDEGVDTGRIVVQKGGVPILDTDTATSLYFKRLYPLGVEAMVEAVEIIDAGGAEFAVQDETRATHQPLVGEEDARIDWSRTAEVVDRLIRGCDPNPGAHAVLERTGEVVRLYAGRREDGAADAAPGTVKGLVDGRLRLIAGDGILSVGKLRVGNGEKVAADECALMAGDRLGRAAGSDE